jgi:hypothetical protein
MQRQIGIAAGRESIFVERKEGELELQPWGKERRWGAHLMEGGERRWDALSLVLA